MNEKFFVISDGVKWKEVNESIIIEPDYALNATAAFVFKKSPTGSVMFRSLTLYRRNMMPSFPI